MTEEKLERGSERFLDTVSKNVARIRKEKQISQLTLALALGYNGSAHIGRAELRKNGKSFSLKQLYKIAKVLEIDINELFIDSDKAGIR